jgi:hypothetical protein
MKEWTIKIRIVDIMGSRPMETIERTDAVGMETVLLLLQAAPGRFEYNGYSAWCGKPCVDPIRQQIVYNVELYGEIES